ncbi:histone-lysine N-methyltransferase 2B-like [Episyrphus balteatus]|uniref:histone-lysine N-methyltransferase 2B-like n=1 Tax=Episyrphus balteatus TaxID=286459 RepID=UPI0024859CF6|nr:histone-lysine N-methyltransferase 2B-like [Episyrphus balteatus]
MKAKAENANYKRNLKATGGGPPPKSPDPEHNKLLALIPHEFEEGECEYDCDTEMMKENVTPLNHNKIKKKEIVDVDFEELVLMEFESPKKYDASSYSPANIPEPLPSQSPPLTSPAITSPPAPPPPSSPPPLNTSFKKKSTPIKRKMNCKDGELLKKELFDFAMENRRTEKSLMQLEH